MQYEAGAGRGVALPWSQLEHVEVRSPRPGAPDAVLVWPVPDSPLRTDPALAPLWSPEVNGIVLPPLRMAFGAAPEYVAYLVAEHSRGAIVPGRARPTGAPQG
jgi:hypothetical protein